MAKSMQHWNGNQLVAIDLETSGTDPFWNEILQICILPLDSNAKPRQDVMPFYIDIAPDRPHLVDPEAMSVNKLDLVRIKKRGHDSEKAKDLLEAWVKTLGLPVTAYGNSKKLIPLGHNYAFDRGFIERWLGPETYNSIFDPRFQDTMVIASFVNNVCAMHADKVLYSKVKLGWLAKQLSVPYENAHDALQDCVITAEVYRRLLQKALPT